MSDHQDYQRNVLRALDKAGISSSSLADHFSKLRQEGGDQAELVWQFVSHQLLRPQDDFAKHQAIFAEVYKRWPRQLKGPAPVWLPTPDDVAKNNIARFLTSFKGDKDFEAVRTGNASHDWALLQQLSCRDPECFWPAALEALGIIFETPPTRAISAVGPNPDRWRWLPGARLNIAHAALNCPRAPAPHATALVWADEGSPAVLHEVSYRDLQQQCTHIAACIKAHFQPGDAIAINMPMTALGTAIYLAVVLAGCVVVSIPDSFAPGEIRTRLHIAHAKAVFTQDVVMRAGKVHPLFVRVEAAGGTPAIVLPATAGGALRVSLRQGDMAWKQFLASVPQQAALASFKPFVGDAYDITNILFSSGTTGEPKAIPWTHLTPLRAGVDAWAQHDVQPGAVVCWPTNLGWMMGPWLIYAALLNGATIALYQGSPLGRDFGEFVAAARVSMLGLVPSIVKAWRHSNCMQGLDWSALRCFSSTGEASAPADQHWLMALAGYKPVVEYCGGTEIGGAFICGSMLQPQAASTFSTPSLGCQLVLLPPQPSSGDVVPAEAATPISEDGPFSGELALVPPVWGGSQALLNKEHYKAYYEGMPVHPASGRPLRRHGDEFQRLPGGFYVALGRCDDTMNLGGIKVSSVELERAILEAVPEVVEAAAVGVPSPGGGPEQLYLFLVPRGHSSVPPKQVTSEQDRLKRLCNAAIHAKLNPLFKVEHVLLRSTLPRTASNKIMRRVLRDEVPHHAKL